MFSSPFTLAPSHWLTARRAQATHPPALPALALNLRAGQVLSLTLRRGERLRVGAGRVWLTAAPEPADHVLTPGQTWVAARRQRVLIEALDGPASVSRLQAHAG